MEGGAPAASRDDLQRLNPEPFKQSMKENNSQVIFQVILRRWKPADPFFEDFSILLKLVISSKTLICNPL